jgi:S-adenosylhomocysteine hydrolase
LQWKLLLASTMSHLKCVVASVQYGTLQPHDRNEFRYSLTNGIMRARDVRTGGQRALSSGYSDVTRMRLGHAMKGKHGKPQVVAFENVKDS